MKNFRGIFFAFFPAIFSALFFSCRSERHPDAQSKICMNTICSVNLFSDGTKNLYDEIFLRLDEIEKTFSPAFADSDVSRVNSAAGISAVEVSDDFLKVFLEAKKISRISGGAFSPVAGALIDLWGVNTAGAKIPSADEIDSAKKLMNPDDVIVSGNSIFLRKRGMKISLGGIVKGFAADEICRILVLRGVKKAMINLGGNVYAFGEKNPGEKWSVGIRDPEMPDGTLLKISASSVSVVTSGGYERFFERNGKKYHHIFDLRTGFPSDSGVLSATVISSSSILCDALSTTFFILGVQETFSLLEKIRAERNEKISVVLVCEYGSVFASADLKNSVSFADEKKGKIIFVD